MDVPVTHETFAVAAELDEPDVLWLLANAYTGPDTKTSYLEDWQAETLSRYTQQIVEWPEQHPPPRDIFNDNDNEEACDHLRSLHPQQALLAAVRARALNAARALLQLRAVDPTNAWMHVLRNNHNNNDDVRVGLLREALAAALVAHVARTDPDALRLAWTTLLLTSSTLDGRDTPLTLAIVRRHLRLARTLAEALGAPLLNMGVPRTRSVAYGDERIRKRPQGFRRTALDLVGDIARDSDRPPTDAEREDLDALRAALVARGALLFEALPPSPKRTKKQRLEADLREQQEQAAEAKNQELLFLAAAAAGNNNNKNKRPRLAPAPAPAAVVISLLHADEE